MAEAQRAIPFTGELLAYVGAQPLACQAAALWPTGVLIYPPVRTLPTEPLRLVIKLYDVGKQVVVNGSVCQELQHGANYAWRVELVDPPPGVIELLTQYVNAKLAAPPLQRTPTGSQPALARPHAVTGPHAPVVRGADPLAVTGPSPSEHDPLGTTGPDPRSSSPGEGYEVSLDAPVVERARASSTAVPERPRLAGPGFYGASATKEAEPPKQAQGPLQKVASRLGLGKEKKEGSSPASTPRKPARLGKPIPRPPPAPALKSAKGDEPDIELDESSGASARRDLVKDLEGYSKSPNRLQDLFRAALKDIDTE